MDLPPDFKPYSLKGRSFTPTFDTSIHNVQGINVWANKAPKPFGQSSTLPRKGSFINVTDGFRTGPLARGGVINGNG